MGRTVFFEIEEEVFNSIRRNKGGAKLDEQRFFKGLNVGDNVILTYQDKKIEGTVNKINVYDSIQEYLNDNKLESFSFDCRNIMNMFDVLESNKKLRFYSVDYHPYNFDDDEEIQEEEFNIFED